MKFNSIRFKASILYTTFLCIILVVFSSILFSFTRHILYRNIDEELQVKAGELITIIKSYEALKETENQPENMIARLLGIEDRARLIIDDLWRSKVRSLNLKNDYINISNDKGRSVIRSQNFGRDIAVVFQKHLPVSFAATKVRNIEYENNRLRAISKPFPYRNRQLVVQVGTPLDSIDRIMHKLVIFIGLGIVFILGLTSFLGAFFTRRILRPVLQVTRTAEDITHSDLNRRIDEPAADEEMKRLIDSFNSMIGRLEESFRHVNEFSSHVAHELKTPLAIIRGEMELALSQPRSPEEYQRVLATGLEEIDRMIRISKDLLLLARLDYNPDVFEFDSLGTCELLQEISGHAKMLAAEKSITVDLNLPAAPVHVHGDKTHLSRLFFNLVGNAVKFTPEGGKIAIDLSVKNRQVQVAVSDTGIGISEDQQEKIFRKFYRAGADDPETEHGSGLGLNIARAIARAHQGDITVKSRPGSGSTFTATFPAV